MSSSRSNYDRMMAEKYNPIREGYNAPPFPGGRTQYDADLQNTFCPSCPYKSIENYGNDNPKSYRTNYDMEMQKTYGSAALGDNDYGKALYKAGFYGKNPSYKENFQDNNAYSTGFYSAGFYNSGTPMWAENYRNRGSRENYSSGPNLYQDPDNFLSYGLFNGPAQ
jgi:hypothetical protein